MKNLIRLSAFAVIALPLIAQAVPPRQDQKFQKKQVAAQKPGASPATGNVKHVGQTLPTGVSPMPTKNAPVATTTVATPAVVAQPSTHAQGVEAAQAPKPKSVTESHSPTLTPVPPTTAPSH